MGWKYNDPALNKYSWKKHRVFWRRLGRPCARCGRAIDYTAKWPHPRSLVVGHIVSRAEARAHGWPEAQINALSNTQPECKTCSDRSGAQLGKRLQKPVTPVPRVIDRW